MREDQHENFPTGRQFMELLQQSNDAASVGADRFIASNGEKLPKTIDGLGAVLSYMYRLACCAWGCKGGDHQIEWITGRIVNQAIASHRLIRSGYYDESFVLTRSIGETANLLWLFAKEPEDLSKWGISNKKERMAHFGPAAVREKLERITPFGPPISKERYAKLCEVGTHPVPNFAPNHFTGSGRPILGCLLQPAGVYVATTELGYATAMCAYPLVVLLKPEPQVSSQLHARIVDLVQNLGAFTIENYEELISNARAKQSGQARN